MYGPLIYLDKTVQVSPMEVSTRMASSAADDAVDRKNNIII